MRRRGYAVSYTHLDVYKRQEEDAAYVAKLVEEKFGITNVMMNPIGATIGAHAGPGTVALFFLGEYR